MSEHGLASVRGRLEARLGRLIDAPPRIPDAQRFANHLATEFPAVFLFLRDPSMGAALLRRRPKGLLPAARQELLDPSMAWWGGRRGRLADRPRYSISVSLGAVPRWYSPWKSQYAFSRGWLRSTPSEPPRLQVGHPADPDPRMDETAVLGSTACTSELHHGRGPGTARPFDVAGGPEHRHRLAVLGHVDEDYHTGRRRRSRGGAASRRHRRARPARARNLHRPEGRLRVATRGRCERSTSPTPSTGPAASPGVR